MSESLHRLLLSSEGLWETEALAGIFVFGETNLSSKEKVASENSKQATHRLLRSKVTCRG